MAYPHLTLPDDIGEVSAQHPITLERLRAINARAAANGSDEPLPSSDSAANDRDTPAEAELDQRSQSSSSAADDSDSPAEFANGLDEPAESINSDDNDNADDSPAEASSSPSENFDSSSDPEADLTTALQQNTPAQQVRSPSVVHIMSELQSKLDRSVQIEVNVSPSNAQKVQAQSTQLSEGLEAIRKIYAAWSKYPSMGGAMDGALISLTDYCNTAMSAVKSMETAVDHSLCRRIAKLMADTIEPSHREVGTLVHEQKRINDCLLAMKQQYVVWKTKLQPNASLTGDELMQELTSDPAAPITYTMQPPQGWLSQPSKPADYFASKNLAAVAEDEAHDSVQIFVSGKVLKTKAEKATDLAGRVAAARAAEAKEAKEVRAAEAEALKASKAAKGRTGKKVTVAASSDVEEGDEILPSGSTRKGSKATPRKRAVAAVDPNDDDDANETFTGKGKKKAVSRKRAKISEDMVISSDEGDLTTAVDADGAAKISKKATRPGKTALNDDAADDSNENDGSSDKLSGSSEDNSSGTPPPAGTVASNKKSRGGKALKWLHDEDDLGRELIRQHIKDNPKSQMPAIWRAFNIEIANTAFQTDNMDTHEYRSDWIPFPRTDSNGNDINDKKARRMDICHRSYESFRQHFEVYKADVKAKRQSNSVASEECLKNLASHLPKRAPPPRPTYFSDGTTLVDPTTQRRRPGRGNNGTTALSSAPSGFADDTPTSAYNGKEYFQSSGWAAINNPVSGNFSPIGSSPSEQPKRRRAAKGETRAELTAPNSSPYPGSAQCMQPENSNDPGHLRSGGDEDDSWMATLPPVKNSALKGKVPDTLEDFVAGQSDDEDDRDGYHQQPVAPSSTRDNSRVTRVSRGAASSTRGNRGAGVTKGKSGRATRSSKSLIVRLEVPANLPVTFENDTDDQIDEDKTGGEIETLEGADTAELEDR
jgi:hypothetical protein